MKAVLLSLIALIALSSAGVVYALAPAKVVPARIILLTVCDKTYGALLVYSDGSVHYVPSMTPEAEPFVKLPEDHIGFLRIKPDVCPIEV